MNCDVETRNKQQFYQEMEENVIIVAGHKLLVKMSINLFFTTHDRENERTVDASVGLLGF